MDRGTFEIVGSTGISSVFLKTAHQLHKARTGSLYHYTITILTAISVDVMFTPIMDIWI